MRLTLSKPLPKVVSVENTIIHVFEATLNILPQCSGAESI
jgi:hypothetical protein